MTDFAAVPRGRPGRHDLHRFQVDRTVLQCHACDARTSDGEFSDEDHFLCRYCFDEAEKRKSAKVKP
jgi:hypothetical protein